MQIKNVTKGTLIAKKAIYAKSIKEKTLGLISFKKPTALLLATRFGIHTFGLLYPIDVLILDHQYKVIATKQKLKPNRIFLWNPKYFTVLELPSGTIKKTKTEKKDILELILH